MNETTIMYGLQRLVWGETPIFTVKEIAEITGRHERTVYFILEGTRALTVEEFVILAREAAGRGDYSLSELSLPDLHTISPVDTENLDGSIDDEVTDEVESLGKAIAFAKRGKDDLAMRELKKCKGLVSRMEAEIKNRKGGR
ncbi:MAG: hypothetical protein JSS75_07430 [Bacteroidetes bacterium]|nr:hypothetical protein [Bacteroidota bacterium]